MSKSVRQVILLKHTVTTSIKSSNNGQLVESFPNDHIWPSVLRCSVYAEVVKILSNAACRPARPVSERPTP